MGLCAEKVAHNPIFLLDIQIFQIKNTTSALTIVRKVKTSNIYHCISMAIEQN
jgi:hypothetical protein